MEGRVNEILPPLCITIIIKTGENEMKKRVYIQGGEFQMVVPTSTPNPPSSWLNVIIFTKIMQICIGG